jgi:uncharacterized protein (DUF2062 family)
MKNGNGNPSAPESRVAILAVIFDVRSFADVQPAIASLQNVHDRVALIVEDDAEKEGCDVNALPVTRIRIDPGTGRGKAIRAAARRARRMGMTHIVTLDAPRLPSDEQIRKFLSAAAANSSAIVVGRRDYVYEPATDIAFDRHSDRSRLRNFWFRLQTGIGLADAASRLRSYPLVVLEQLKLHAKRDAFDAEILTKAAWAGAAIQEVGIRMPPPAAADRIPFWQSIRSTLADLLMNVHLTMRSITPLPHRKIVTPADRPEESVSVFRPLKSIRTLLTENVTPVQLAAAAGMGVFLGALPLIALHTVVILFVSSYFRLNKVATLAASQLCMPPVIPALCIETGYFLRHGEFLTEISFKTLGYEALERLWEWLLGSLVVAPVLAALVGGLVFVTAGLISRGMGLGRTR